MDEVENKLTKRERKALAKEEKRKQRKQREKSSKLIKLAVAVIVIAALGLGSYKAFKWINTPTETVFPTELSISEDDWVRGNREAKVVLFEFADFQCPACATYYPILQQAADELGEDVAFVYKQFPLESIHKNSRIAAFAAEAAGIQGKFWEMHDKLYDKQDEWSEEGNPKDKFITYADELELDLDQFKTDMDNQIIKDKIDKSIQLAFALRINSTPTVYVNGDKIQLPANYAALKSTLEQYINTSSDEQL